MKQAWFVIRIAAMAFRLSMCAWMSLVRLVAKHPMATGDSIECRIAIYIGGPKAVHAPLGWFTRLVGETS